MNCTRHLAHDPRCNECTARAQAGPHYDSRRGTGRTTQRLKTALMSALGGKRVLFVTHTMQYADDLRRYAVELLGEAGLVPALGNVSALRISFKNGGWLHFRGMAQGEPHGMREYNKPTVTYWDHFAEEERARLAKAAERQADADTIKGLMRKQGWRIVEDERAGRLYRDRLVFNT